MKRVASLMSILKVKNVVVKEQLSMEVHSGNLTWQWNIPILSRKYIFTGSIFQCYVSLPGGITGVNLYKWPYGWLVATQIFF